MTTCAYLMSTDKPCGRPAVASWEHPVTGVTPLCRWHDDHASAAIRSGIADGSQWHRSEASQSVREGQGRPMGTEAMSEVPA